MSSPWEDVSDDTSPFADVPEVDGLVYAEETLSPELRMTSGTFAPPPVPAHRPAPVKPTPRSVAQWQPGHTVDPAKFRRKAKRPNPVQGVLLGLIPLAIVFGLLYFTMHLYGMR